MTRRQQNKPVSVLALQVHQWLPDWDAVIFDELQHRRQPQEHFYLFSLAAPLLRALSGINRRATKDRKLGQVDIGIQRRHDSKRSDEIREYVQYGYPWPKLTEAQKESMDYEDLLKPGWLPTALVVNILTKEDERRGAKVATDDLIEVADSENNTAHVNLPKKFSGRRWKAQGLAPIEIIDGQHRLWAFDGDEDDIDLELPVVAFVGLDISWQAYLFWTINIRPVRINPSLAFDLYPLLRTEDWLERVEGHSIYRETRAQELTEVLWAHPDSPWYQTINMLGEPGQKRPMVTQASWIRSLIATFIKEGRSGVGGLFTAPVGSDLEPLAWSRTQQAAFLILIGQEIRNAVEKCRETWAKQLRAVKGLREVVGVGKDLAFYGPHSLISTDQGIRGILYVANDLCFIRAKELGLAQWVVEDKTAAEEDMSVPTDKSITVALKSLRSEPVFEFVDTLANVLASYDWRTSSAPGLTEDEQLRKAALRGSGGYKELRRQLLRTLAREGGSVGQAAKQVISALGYDKE